MPLLPIVMDHIDPCRPRAGSSRILHPTQAAAQLCACLPEFECLHTALEGVNLLLELMSLSLLILVIPRVFQKEQPLRKRATGGLVADKTEASMYGFV